MKGRKMYRRILIATDGSELAGHAVTQGLSLAKDLGAQVTMVNVTELWSVQEMAARADMGSKHPTVDYETWAATHAAKILAIAKEAAEMAGVRCETLHVPDARPATGIVAAAKERDCDLIVMGSHGRRGLGRLVLGSQAAEVIAASKLPVLICR